MSRIHLFFRSAVNGWLDVRLCECDRTLNTFFLLDVIDVMLDVGCLWCTSHFKKYCLTSSVCLRPGTNRLTHPLAENRSAIFISASFPCSPTSGC